MQTEEIVQTITDREKEWMQAWIDRDEDKFRNILSDDFLLSSARGAFMNKEEWIYGALHSIHAEGFEWKEIKVRVYDHTAVVNAVASQKASVNGQDWSGRFMITDVWVFQNQQWQVVTRQGTGPLEK